MSKSKGVIQCEVRGTLGYKMALRSNFPCVVMNAFSLFQKKLWIAICLAILILILVISLVATFGT